MDSWVPAAMHEWNKARFNSGHVTKPRIERHHIDGPMLVLGDGRIYWLTLWERFLLRLGKTNAAKLEQKYERRKP